MPFPRPPARLAHLVPGRAELLGGSAAALVSLPVSMTYGIVAFATLGPSHVGSGIVAGIFGAIAICAIAPLAGSRSLLASGPRAAAAVVFAAVVGAALETDALQRGVPQADAVAIALMVGFAAVALAGLMQMLVGRAHLGQLARYMPAPVIAGFVNASALIVVLGQAPLLFGLSTASPLAELRENPARVLEAGTLAGFVTVLLMVLAPRVTQRVPAPLVALVGGTLFFHGLALAAGAAEGALLQPIASPLPSLPFSAVALAQLDASLLPALALLVVPAAFSMMALASLETLLSQSALDDRTGTRSDPDRELVAQGLGNLGAALVGGITGSGGLNRTLPLLDAGARRASAHLVTALCMLLLVLVAYPLVGAIPQPVVSGMILVLGISLLDRWSLGLIASLRHARQRRHRARVVDTLIIVGVVAVALVSDMMTAVGVGLLLAVIVFVTRMSRRVVRSIRHGPGIHSRRQWTSERAARLRDHAGRIAVVELDGVLFFGTAHSLEVAIDAELAAGVDWFVLDLRRLRDLDLSGARALQRISNRVSAGGALHLACVRDDGSGAMTRELGDAGLLDPERVHEDIDAALAACEDALLEELAATRVSVPARRSLRRSELLQGLDRADLRALRPVLERVGFPAGTTIFEQGDAGDSVYFVARGRADIVIDVEHGTSTIHSLRPGSVFGEMAVLDGHARAAGVRAVEPVLCYRLSVADFQALERRHPSAAMKIYTNLCRVFSRRLRAANAMIAELER